jgi:benzoyl-CoA reductase subunit C
MAIEDFVGLYDSRHDYARRWKEEGNGKVLGYFCTYIPEEILYAANVLPVRILGSHEPHSTTEQHVFGMYCPFCRDCLAQGLEGKYDYLDGLMIAQSCMHIRQTFHSWRQHRPVGFDYTLPMPAALEKKAALPFLVQEYEVFKRAVEDWVGKKITEEDLRRGVDIMNRNRRLLKRAYGLRKSAQPALTGVEAMYLVASSQMADKRQHSDLLEAWLDGDLKEGRLAERDPGVRLMLIGSEDDDIRFLELVENSGSTVVTDDHCTGTRYFWEEVEEGLPLLEAIARRYIQRTPCPSKDWPTRKRFSRILEFAKGYGVEGAIYAQQKFCDPHEADEVALVDMLKQNGIKTLALEFDVTLPVGPFKIRVDAFVETLTTGDLF